MRNNSIIYFLLGMYAVLVSWYYNHSIFLAILHYIYWPIYLIYELFQGNLANGMAEKILRSYL